MPCGSPTIPSARLISTIGYPLETLYVIWMASRGRERLPSPEELHHLAKNDVALALEIQQTFRHAIESDIPVAENLDFIFLLEGIPVSLREQIVRHRIGHRFGENFAVDMVPGDVQSSWWSQSMRILDMGEFAVRGEFFQPDTVDDRPIELEGLDGNATLTAEELYARTLLLNQRAYSLLVKAGIPPEDARQLIPLAATSRLTWKMNYQALKHIVRRRGCWIAQLGMWRPIITDIVNELAGKVDKVFRNLINPPCIERDRFTACPFVQDNIERMLGKDPEPPCTLFLHHHGEPCYLELPDPSLSCYHPADTSCRTWEATDAARSQRFAELQQAYVSLWHRNVWTGEPLELGVDANA